MRWVLSGPVAGTSGGIEVRGCGLLELGSVACAVGFVGFEGGKMVCGGSGGGGGTGIVIVVLMRLGSRE